MFIKRNNYYFIEIHCLLKLKTLGDINSYFVCNIVRCGKQ